MVGSGSTSTQSVAAMTKEKSAFVDWFDAQYPPPKLSLADAGDRLYKARHALADAEAQYADVLQRETQRSAAMRAWVAATAPNPETWLPKKKRRSK